MIPDPVLSNKDKGRRGSVLPVVLVVIILCVIGYFGWMSYEKYRKAKDDERAARQAKNKEIEAKNAERRKPDTNVVVTTNLTKPPQKRQEQLLEPPKKEEPQKKESDDLREQQSVWKAVWAQSEEARKKVNANPPDSFAGIRFGEPIKSGTPVKWGTALDELAGDSIAARGVAFAVYGPKLAKPFNSLGTTPLVWVTPQTRRPYRIEFSRPLAPGTETKHDPETTNLVAMIQSRFSSEPFVPRPSVPGRAGCEYVFPIGSATVMIGEYDGILRFVVQREDIREEALAETEALRQRMNSVSADGDLLDSKRYPNGGVDPKKYRGVRFRDGTPPSFCGVVFMSAPAENTTIQVPQKGAKGFFLDYRMAKCPPFRGFVYGRADIDPVRGGVYAIHLTSEGGVYGQDDKDYYETVKASLSAHYKVKPIEKPGEGAFPNLIYQVGDVTIVFGPDPCGGFRLFARNEVLTALAHTDPAANTRKR